MSNLQIVGATVLLIIAFCVGYLKGYVDGLWRE